MYGVSGRLSENFREHSPGMHCHLGGNGVLILAHAVTFALAVAPILLCPLWHFPKQFWNLRRSFWFWLILCVAWFKKKNKINDPKGIIFGILLWSHLCQPSTNPIHIFEGLLNNNFRMFIFIEPWSSRNKLLDVQASMVLWDL